MLTLVAVLVSLAFIGWIIWRAARKKPIKAHLVSYALSCVAGIYTFAFFLNMDIPKMLKIVACIVIGGLLIFIAAWLQRREQLNQQ